MTTFTEADRKLILKIARKMQLMENDIKTLQKTEMKKSKENKYSKSLSPDSDNINATFSKESDLKTATEREYALNVLYKTIRNMCAETGVIKLTLDINLQREGI